MVDAVYISTQRAVGVIRCMLEPADIFLSVDSVSVVFEDVNLICEFDFRMFPTEAAELWAHRSQSICRGPQDQASTILGAFFQHSPKRAQQ